jgi:glutamyl-tRNA synthetase
MVRTALFNWAYARHTGGTFVFRIEDTDSARDSEESYEALLSALEWLGLTWDEGPNIGGPYGPYRQSERMSEGTYSRVADQLLEGGFAYHCYCSTDELDARREQAMAEKRAPGYDGHCRSLTADQVAAYQAEGRAPVLRFRMPDGDSTWDDLVRGPITFAADQVPDYVLVRANGEPLYTLVNPVDDALMRITHVLRGEDLLSSTPRQLALYEAMAKIGVSDGTTPRFGHLPYVMGEGNRKLSKRDPESSLQMYRNEGYLPEGLLNYLALLGWSMGEDREFFSKEELATAFTLERVSPNPARFDLKKCTAINADWIRALSADELVKRVVPYLAEVHAVATPTTPQQEAVLAAAIPLVQERMETLKQSVSMLAFLLVPQERFALDPTDASAVLTPGSVPVLDASILALESLEDWTASGIETALRAALIEGLGLKPKVAFGPVRVAVTGRRISPPLFESLEILRRPLTLQRLADARSWASSLGESPA